MQCIVAFFVQSLIPLIQQVSWYVDRGIHLYSTHVLSFGLRSNKGLRWIINEFLDEVQSDQSNVSQKEKNCHGERELSWGVPGRLVIDRHLEYHLWDGLEEEFGENLNLKAIF